MLRESIVDNRLEGDVRVYDVDVDIDMLVLIIMDEILIEIW